MSQPFLDADGNINADRLSKELQSALEFDTRYRLTDNMKKRAVKTASSYDEFKAMVACAHLKKLTRKEVESLSNVKKGWKKTPTASSDASAALLEMENEQANIRAAQEQLLKKTGKKRKETLTAMELQRDLGRAQGDGAKLSFLNSLGLEKVSKAVERGADIDLLEEMLRVVVAASKLTTTSESEQEAEASMSASIAEWLTLISRAPKFEMMLQFAKKQLRADLCEMLASMDAPEELRRLYGAI